MEIKKSDTTTDHTYHRIPHNDPVPRDKTPVYDYLARKVITTMVHKKEKKIYLDHFTRIFEHDGTALRYDCMTYDLILNVMSKVTPYPKGSYLRA